MMRETFAKLTKTPLPPTIPTDLDNVIRNPEAIESLNNISLFSVAEMVNIEPIRLYLNLSQAVGVINSWLDEGLLYYHFEPHMAALRARGIRKFTELMEHAITSYGTRTMTWALTIVVVNNPADDAAILASLQATVKTLSHHRLLGILSTNYRRTWFLP
jgi:hypothetical protein